MSERVFGKIVRGEIPVTFVYEDEFVVAFDDIAPQAPVHTLVVTREQYANLNDPISTDVAVGLVTA